MTIEYDNKGIFFTDVVSKVAYPALVFVRFSHHARRQPGSNWAPMCSESIWLICWEEGRNAKAGEKVSLL